MLNLQIFIFYIFTPIVGHDYIFYNLNHIFIGL